MPELGLITKLPGPSGVVQEGANPNITPNGNLGSMPEMMLGIIVQALNVPNINHGHTNSHQVIVNLANMAPTEANKYSGVVNSVKTVYQVGTEEDTVEDIIHNTSGTNGTIARDSV